MFKNKQKQSPNALVRNRLTTFFKAVAVNLIMGFIPMSISSDGAVAMAININGPLIQVNHVVVNQVPPTFVTDVPPAAALGDVGAPEVCSMPQLEGR